MYYKLIAQIYINIISIGKVPDKLKKSPFIYPNNLPLFQLTPTHFPDEPKILLKTA